MYFDRFDIAEAHYLFLCDYHEGQGSEKYRRLCRLLGWFRPGLAAQQGALTPNGQDIYDQLAKAEADRLNTRTT